MHTIFVYGTLKRGHRNNHVIEDGKFCGTGFTARLFAMHDCGFPVVMMNEKIARVSGEIYEVDDDVLRRLDRLEGVECGMYVRRKVLVLSPSGSRSCWMYVGPHRTWGKRRLARVEAENGFFNWVPAWQRKHIETFGESGLSDQQKQMVVNALRLSAARLASDPLSGDTQNDLHQLADMIEMVDEVHLWDHVA